MCLLVWRNMIYDKTVVSYSSLCVQHLVYVWHAVVVKKKKSVEGINKQVNKERNEGITLETLNIIQLRLCQGLTDYYYKVTIDTLSWE